MDTEQKLAQFSKVILDEVNEWCDALTKEADETAKTQFAAAETAALGEIHEAIRKEIEADAMASSREISFADLAAKREVIGLRDRLTQQLFDHVQERIEAFVASEEYTAFLQRSLQKHLDRLQKGAVVLARAEDTAQVRQALAALQATAAVEADNTIQLGGFRLRDGGLLLDETLDERLAQQRAWFTEHSHFTVDAAQ